MRTTGDIAADARVWGDHVSYDDVARLEYARRLWRYPEMRTGLLAHWTDERHPYRERFAAQQKLIESVLESEEPLPDLEARLRQQGTSLRCVAREVPPVFGSFFEPPAKPS